MSSAEISAIRMESAPPCDGLGIAAGDGFMVGRSPRFLGAVELARRFAETSLPILILGDTGTGKELLAQYVHSMSERQGVLVDVNCGALPDELLDGLLFGHRRGAFTGAHEHAEGLVEKADGGTLFLDELASLSPRGQAKLLRVLETGVVRRVGATLNRRVDFRLISTIQGNPDAIVKNGSFRLDLMQRVAGVTIRLPSLSERVEDIVPLGRFFARARGAVLSSGAEDVLRLADWPGNVRELRWTVERAAVLAPGQVVDRDVIVEAMEMSPSVQHTQSQLGAFSVAQLRATCDAHGGNPRGIAQSLGVSRATLYRWLRAAGISLRNFKGSSETN